MSRKSSKYPGLLVHEAKPLNASPPRERLIDEALTPTERFFIRNHAPVPRVRAASYRLHVSGEVERSLTLSLDQIRADFASRTVTATLECAGNRRDEFGPIPGQLAWGAEAIGTATWTGAPLADVLRAASITSAAQHVAFLGLDGVERHGETFGFGGSVPMNKALRPEVLVAYEMNGEPLSPEHGFPLRMVVPGYIGARSVKWLSAIEVRAHPSDNYFQQHAYRMDPPDAPGTGPMLGEITVNSAIISPADREKLPAGDVELRGYAVGTGGVSVESVELSVDGGQSWLPVDLPATRDPYRWTLWSGSLTLAPGEHEILVRARDASGNAQPADIETIRNAKGYMNNAWHRVRVIVV